LLTYLGAGVAQKFCQDIKNSANLPLVINPFVCPFLG